MPLLIDGYNLLHVTGLFGRGKSSLEASRNALLDFLAAAMEPADRAQTTLVFDAAEAPPGLPDHYEVHGMAVRYARDYESADELLEVLIAAQHAPRKLTVVSSDRRVQRAAKRRRATAVDSDVWYRAAAHRLQQRRLPADVADVDRNQSLTPAEVDAWLRTFGPIDIPEDLLAGAPEPPAPTTVPKTKGRTKRAASGAQAVRDDAQASPSRPAAPRVKPAQAARPAKKRGKPTDLGFGDVSNPFPPGYGDDAARET